MIHKFWKKITALSLIVSFSVLEIGFAYPLPVCELLQGLQPEKKAEETQSLSVKPQAVFFVPDSLSFLESEGPLSEVIEEASSPLISKNLPLQTNELNNKSETSIRYDTRPERVSFEDAVEELRPEYASAFILKDINEENVKTLTTLGYETALIVLDGEIVLFSTGNQCP